MATSHIVLALLVSSFSFGPVLSKPRTSQLDERALSLPTVEPNQPCPTSTGRHDVVPSQPQIFGAGGFWFGRGPVFLGLFYKNQNDDRASFNLSPIPRDSNGHRAKTGWAIDPSYSGPIMIRGHGLSAYGTALGFRATGSQPEPVLRLTSPNVSPATLWSFWPSSMWIDRPGCYGVQIDTAAGTDVVVFRTE